MKDQSIQTRLAVGDIGEYDCARVILRHALHKLATPDNWLQGAPAEDAAGKDVYPWDDAALSLIHI